MNKLDEKQPTQEQIKEFWEWCNPALFRYIHPSEQSKARARGEIFASYPVTLQTIDLNNLFKYAVPKVKSVELKVVNLENTGNLSGWYCSAQVANKQIGEIKHSGIQNDPALALFWAIWSVIHAG